MMIRTLFWLCVLWVGLGAAARADVVKAPQRLPALAAKSDWVVRSEGDVLVVEFTGSYQRNLDGAPNHAARQQVAQAVYSRLRDDYDFIVVLPAFPIDLGQAIGLHWQVRNAVTGIGRPLLDVGPEFGSARRLLGYIDIDESLLPTHLSAPALDSLLDTLMHEIMHQWGVYAPLLAQVGDDTTRLSVPSSHWASGYHSDASVMYGGRWRSLPEGRFQNTTLRQGFSDLDLYLAGFLAPAELQAQRWVRTTDLDPETEPKVGQIVTGELIEAPSGALLEQLGPRSPDHTQAQRRFRAALVVLARPGQVVPPSLLGNLHLIRAQAQARFAASTLGRGHLELGTGVDAQRPDRGAPAAVESPAAPLGSFNAELARTWLQDRRRASGPPWQDKSATAIQDSVWAMRALDPVYLTDPDQRVQDLQRVRSAHSASTNLDARAATLLLDAPADLTRRGMIETLREARRPDGGYALKAGEISTALDTANVLHALIQESRRTETTVAAADIAPLQAYLLDRYDPQQACWSAGTRGTCDLLTSTTALHALALGMDPALLHPHAEGLYRWQGQSGAFGVSGARIYATAIAIQALHAAGQGIDPRVLQARDWLIAQQLGDGSFGTGIAATSAALMALEVVGKPDLAILEPPSLEPNTPFQGQAVLLRTRIHNRGLNAAPASTLQLRLAPADHGAWTELPYAPVIPALGAGATYPVEVVVDTAGMAPGAWRLEVRLDPQAQIEEASESNNHAELLWQIAAPPEGVELELRHADLQVTPPIVSSVPQSLQVRLKAHNLGRTAALAVPVSIEGMRFGARVPLHRVPVDLPAQSAQTLDLEFELTDADIRELLIRIDPDQAHAEPNESNNQLGYRLDQQATIDLVLEPGDITLPPQFEVGAPAEFQVRIHNRGTRDAPTTTLKVEVRREDEPFQTLEVSPVQLDAGMRIQRSVRWTAQHAGLYQLRFTVDPDNAVAEVAEDNNQVQLNVEVGNSSTTNLQVVPNSWVLTPEPALQGQPVQATVTVVNTSTLPSGPFDVQFSAAFRSSSIFQPLQTVRIEAGLAPGESLPVIVTLPVDLPVERQLQVHVDSADEIAESTEDDNRSLRMLQALSLPNLQVSLATSTLQPSQPAPGASMRVQVEVRNTGQQPAPPHLIHYEAITDAGRVNLAAPTTLPALEPDQSTTHTLDVVRAAEWTAIEVMVDSDQNVNEGREDDNQVRLSLAVADPDFLFSETYISPNGDGIQDRTEFRIRIDPPQPARLRIVAPWGEEMMRWETSAGSEQQLIGVWDGTRANGRRVLDERYLAQLETAAGERLKVTQLVVDTNRSPLVSAAEDGQDRVRPLGCEVPGLQLYEPEEAHKGPDFVLASGGNPNAVYRFNYDGSPPVRLLETAAIPGINGSNPGVEFWLDRDRGEVYYLAHVDGYPGQTAIYRSGLDGRAAPVRVATSAGIQGGKILGRWQDGRLILGNLSASTSQGLYVVDPASGHSQELAAAGEVESAQYGRRGVVPAVGRDSVLAALSRDAYERTRFRLYRAGGVSDIDVEVPRAVVQHGVPVVVVYSPLERAYYYATGVLDHNAYVPDNDFEVIYRIDEVTAEVRRVKYSELRAEPANYAVSLSPDGRTLAILSGAAAELELTDLGSGNVLRLNLATHRPDYDRQFESGVISSGFFAAIWSNDSSHLALRLEVHDSPNFRAAKSFGSGQEIGPYRLAYSTVLVKISDGSAQHLADFDARAWVDGELQLVGGNIGILVERGMYRSSLVADASEVRHWRSGVVGPALPLNIELPGGCSTAHSLQSSANGYVDLTLEFVAAAESFLLRGSATDLNFARATLSYRAIGQSQWIEFNELTEPVDDSTFSSWTPPGVGRFEVRLQVQDRAGNQRQVVQPLVWFGDSSLGAVRVSPSRFSPNSDGVRDNAVLEYDVRLPHSVDIQVENSSGTLIRRESRTHIATGRQVWVWDGRDAAGLLQPDGVYRIRVGGRGFSVILDATAPELDIRQGAMVCRDSSIGNLTVSAADPSLVAVRREVDDGVGGWIVVGRDHVINSEGKLLSRYNASPDQLEQGLRVVAEDAAGNQTVRFAEDSGGHAYITDVVAANGRLARAFGKRAIDYSFDESMPIGVVVRVPDVSGWVLEIQSLTSERVPPVESMWAVHPHRIVSAPWLESGFCFSTLQTVLEFSAYPVEGSSGYWVRLRSTEAGTKTSALGLVVPTEIAPVSLGDCLAACMARVGLLDTCLIQCNSLDGTCSTRVGTDFVTLPIRPSPALTFRVRDPLGGGYLGVPAGGAFGGATELDIRGLAPGLSQLEVMLNGVARIGNVWVGKDTDGAPRLSLIYPPQNALICANEDIVLEVTEQFLDGVAFIADGGEQQVNHGLKIPVPGGPDYLSVSPQTLLQQPLVRDAIVRDDQAFVVTPIEVKALDCPGRESRLSLRYRVDAGIQIGPVEIGPSADRLSVPGLYTANGGLARYLLAPSLGQSVYVGTNALEPLTLTTTLQSAGMQVDPETGLESSTISGVALRVLDVRPLHAGRYAVQWDGRNSAGELVADGAYGLMVEGVDGCGFEGGSYAVVGVDNTPPDVHWSPELAGSEMALFQPLTGIVQDAHPAMLDVAYRRLGDSSWSLIAGGISYANSVPQAPYAVWNSAVPAGTYELRLQASDQLGHTAADVVQVIVPERSPLLLAANRSPDVFSPNADGVLDRASLQLQLARAGQIEVNVVNAAGQVILPLMQDMGTGVVHRQWDGSDSSEAVVADGDYQFRVVAVDPATSGYQESVELPVRVDRTPPQLRWRLPAGEWSAGRGALVAELEERHPASFTISSVPLMSGLRRQHSTAGVLELARLDETEEGIYTLSWSAEDQVGNRSNGTHTLRIDRTGPLVRVLSPAPDSHHSRERGVISVRGEVGDAHLHGWTLRVLDTQGVLVRELGQGNTAPDGMVTVEWLASEADGSYLLELEARDLAGNRTARRVPVVLDHTAPLVRVDTPLAQAAVALTYAVTGAVNDDHLESFQLDVAQLAQQPDWQRVMGGSEAVEGALGTAVALSPDGPQLLRLSAVDRAGNRASVVREVRVDTVPPSAPLELRAERVGARDVRLLWTASTAPDVLQYRVHRAGTAPINTGTPATQWQHGPVSDGEHRYTVSALDAAGNESPRSNTASVLIDTTPPEVRLSTPRPEQRLGGELRIEGRAYSREDFARYTLVLDVAGVSTEVASATSPVQGGELARLDTRVWADTPARLTLSAVDQSGNAASHSVDFHIDNLPPAAPQGVMASEDNGAVQIVWTANVEADLAGYLVYRGSELLQGSGSSDPRTLVIQVPAWRDDVVGDGVHAWRVVAVDTTGNLSDFSDPASLQRSGHPPRARLVRPGQDERFDTRIRMRGVSADLDLVSVQFEARAEGAPSWTAVLDPYTLPPFEGDFEPSAGAYGPYRLRARATDTEGLTDPAPPEVRVQYTDLTPPGAPESLQVQVDGGEVQLTWSAVADADLHHYQIERAGQTSAFQPLADVNAQTLTHVDTVEVDGQYRYRVRAVDGHDNRSTPGPEQPARVYRLTLDRPYTPTLDAAVSVQLQTPVAGQLEASRVQGGDTHVAAELALGVGTHALNWPLLSGDQTWTFRLRDAAGHRSRAATLRMTRSSLPPVPTDLVATVNGLQLRLDWSTAAHDFPLGWRVWRNHVPLESDAAAELTGAMMPSGPDFNELIDGDTGTGFGMSADDPPVVFQLSLGAESIVTRVDVAFAEAVEAAAMTGQLALEGRWQGDWIPLPLGVARSGAQVQLVLLRPYRTQALRVHVTPVRSLALTELGVRMQPVHSTPLLERLEVDGLHQYRVATINAHGYASEPGPALEVAVGDAEAPPAVVLSGTVTGSDAALEWTASAAPDLAAYHVYRNGVRLAVLTDTAVLSYNDPGLVNGQYDYRVLAVDAAGNASTSNLLILIVDVGALLSPRDLQVSATGASGVLQLQWSPGVGGVMPTRYRIRRGLSDDGPYHPVGETAATTYSDQGLQNGTRYHYTITALDAVGNASAPSAPASAVPYSDQPVARPVMLYPTAFGRAHTQRHRSAVVAGMAQPGARVQLGVGGVVLPEVPVPTEVALRHWPLTVGGVVAAPDGARVYQNTGSTGQVLTLEGAQRLTLGGQPCMEPVWLDAESILHCEPALAGQRLVRTDVHSATRVVLLELSQVSRVISPPGSAALLILARLDPLDSEQRLYRWTPGTAPQVVAGVDVSLIDIYTAGLHPGGRWLTYRDPASGQFSVLDLDTAQIALTSVQMEYAVVPGFIQDPPAALIHGDGPAGSISYAVDLQTLALTPLDTGPGRVLHLDLDPLHQRLGVLTDNADWRFLRWPELTLEAEGRLAQTGRLQRLGTGEWMVLADDAATRLQPPGVFRVDGVPLAFGSNRVAAIARAPGQLDSAPALPIDILVPADGLPDLVLREVDLSVLPNQVQPGSAARIGARIRNIGSAPAAATTVRYTLRDPNGAVLQNLDRALPALAVGRDALLAWDTPMLADSGLHLVEVQVNPEAALVESNLANNRAGRAVVVNADGRPELTLRSHRDRLAPEQRWTGDAQVIIVATGFTGRVRSRVLDDQSHLVQQLDERPVSGLQPGQTLELPLQWQPGAVLAGRYRIQVQLLDAAGVVVRERETPVVLEAWALLHVDLQPGQVSVRVGEPIQTQARIRMLATNTRLQDAELRVQLQEADGTERSAQVIPLPELGAGYSGDVPLSFASSGLAPGAYQLAAGVWSGDLRAEGLAAVTVLDATQAPQLSGRLEVPTLPLSAGASSEFRVSVRNTGAVVLNNLPLAATLRTQAGSQVIARIDPVRSLQPGESWEGVLPVPAGVLEPGAYVLSWSVSSGALSGLLDARSVPVIDDAGPLVLITRPAPGAIIHRRVPIEARITDLHGVVAQAELSAGAASPVPMSPSTTLPAHYTASLPAGVAEGPLTLRVQALDEVGNAGQSAAIPVVLDDTPPQILIEGVVDGMVYAQPVSPVVSALDAHLQELQVVLDGLPFVVGSSVAADGPHSLYAVATDAAGNRSTRVLNFAVDRTPPTLVFTAPPPDAVVQADRITVQLATEPGASVSLLAPSGFAPVSADVSGVARFDEVPLVEGSNLLRASAVDAVGNQSLPVERSVVRQNSTLGLVSGSLTSPATPLRPTDPVQGSVRVSSAASVALQDLSVRLELRALSTGSTLASQQWLLNLPAGGQQDQSFDFPAAPWALGAYTLELSAQLSLPGGSLAWVQLDQASVSVADLDPPLAAWISPAANALLNSAVSVQVQASDALSELVRVDLQLDGETAQPMVAVPGELERYQLDLGKLAEGPHTLHLAVEDAAGGVTTLGPHPFSVDATPPVITITGVLDGQLANTPLTPVVVVTDVHPGTTEITLNGQPHASGQAVSTEGPHALQVSATDAAGNSAQSTLQFTLDFTPPPVVIVEPLADSRPSVPHVPLVVQTEAGIEVTYIDPVKPRTALSDESGLARFAAIPLVMGENQLWVRAEDRAGNRSDPVTVRVVRVSPKEADVSASLQHPATLEHGRSLQGTIRLRARIPDAGKLDEVRLQVYAGTRLLDTLVQTTTLPLNTDVDLGFARPTSTWPLASVQLRVSWRRSGATGWTDLAEGQVTLLDLTAPFIGLLQPQIGDRIEDPQPVLAHVTDALSPVTEVSVRLNNGPWQALQPAPGLDLWEGQIAFPYGLHNISLRATDAPGNQRILGPIPLCRPSFVLFADGFEFREDRIFRSGFEGPEVAGCPNVPKALRRLLQPWGVWPGVEARSVAPHRPEANDAAAVTPGAQP